MALACAWTPEGSSELSDPPAFQVVSVAVPGPSDEGVVDDGGETPPSCARPAFGVEGSGFGVEG